jgi:hypothetical protein
MSPAHDREIFLKELSNWKKYQGLFLILDIYYTVTANEANSNLATQGGYVGLRYAHSNLTPY